ncbi:hypothetical protein F53441_2426 [Fusarium austroafricanum]|uniref:Uncharacterized protein n=1 Tax=Fusarium austroafricanum TaxID=2364996 RepID=A0A8H4KTX1_9HYPO|nr:hypothetical protein F53441_2426 [Fusarium austroafricanum]
MRRVNTRNPVHKMLLGRERLLSFGKEIKTFEELSPNWFGGDLTNDIDILFRTPLSINADFKIPRPIPESYASYQEFQSYSFVEFSNVGSLSQSDLDYLYNQHCFHLPGKDLMDKLIKLYILHVHSMLPLLDDRSFWSTYLQASKKQYSSGNRIPLLLLWSVLFAASGVLFTMSSDASPVVLGQSAILLSFQAYSLNFQIGEVSDADLNDNSNTVWLQTAIEHARNANAETTCCLIVALTEPPSETAYTTLGKKRDLLIPKQYELPNYAWFEDELPWLKVRMVEDILILDSSLHLLRHKTISELEKVLNVVEKDSHLLRECAIKLSASHQELLLRTSIATAMNTAVATSDLLRIKGDIEMIIADISGCVIEFMQLGFIPYLYVGVATFAALPYLLQVLDSKVLRQPSPEGNSVAKYHRLCSLTAAVKEYQSRYGNMHLLGGTIQFIITNFHLFARTASIPTDQQLTFAFERLGTTPVAQELEFQDKDNLASCTT